jgi:hypothetical protein
MPLAAMTVTLDDSELRVSSPCVRVVVSLGVCVMSRSLVPAAFWLALAERAGAVDSAVRVSDRSFTGWVVEPVFESYQSASDFARRASGVVGLWLGRRLLLLSLGRVRCPVSLLGGCFLLVGLLVVVGQLFSLSCWWGLVPLFQISSRF